MTDAVRKVTGTLSCFVRAQDGKRMWRKARGLKLEPTPSMLPVLSSKGDVLGDFQPHGSGKVSEDD